MKYFFTLFLLMSVLGALGQMDYRPGFIITLNHDTIYGKINYVDDVQNSLNCNFKSDYDIEIQRFKPGEILAYRFVNSKYYVTKEVKVEDNNRLLFLEFLIKGKVNVYFCRTERGDHYFIEKDSMMNELVNEDITFIEEGVTYSRESQQYKGVLNYYFQDCPELQREISDISLQKKSVIKLTKKYHELSCSSEQCTVFERPEVKVKTELAISAKYSSATFWYGHTNFGWFFKCDDYPLTMLDMNIKMNIPDLNENIFVGSTLRFVYVLAPEKIENYLMMDIRSSNISLAGLLLDGYYKYPFGKLIPYFHAGIGFYRLTHMKIMNAIGETIEGFDNLKTSFGFTTGAGLQYNLNDKVFLFISGNYESIQSRAQGISGEFGVGYLLK